MNRRKRATENGANPSLLLPTKFVVPLQKLIGVGCALRRVTEKIDATLGHCHGRAAAQKKKPHL